MITVSRLPLRYMWEAANGFNSVEFGCNNESENILLLLGTLAGITRFGKNIGVFEEVKKCNFHSVTVFENICHVTRSP